MALRFDGQIYSIDELATIAKVTNGKDEPTHLHQFIELVYILRGKCVQLVDGTEYPVARGHLLLINETQQHSMVCQPGTDYINILMKPQIISESLGDTANAFSLLALKDFSEFKNTVDRTNCCIRFEGAERTRLEMLLEWLLQEQNRADSGNELILRSGLNMLLIQVFRKMALPMLPANLGIDQTLLAYIRNHCHHRLTVEEIAEQCGYDASYFSRLFKRCTGKNFTVYITDCRMEKACALLADSHLSVDSVIAACGFSDRTKFFRQFTNRTGMTPLQYRKSKNEIL